jgi:adenosine deaminase
MMDGVLAAIGDARQEWGIEGVLICTAQRHRDEASGLELLGLLEPWRDQIIGVGLGSAERGNPPSKFARYFANARGRGYRITVHAGEDGPADYVREALDVCRPDRIDHGVMIMSDQDLVERIRDEQVALTMCPLSNRALQVVPDLADHPLAELLRRGLLVTVNSDDPPFFGGYVNDNYRAIASAVGLSEAEIVQLASNSITASFASESEKVRYLAAIDEVAGAVSG